MLRTPAHLSKLFDDTSSEISAVQSPKKSLSTPSYAKNPKKPFTSPKVTPLRSARKPGKLVQNYHATIGFCSKIFSSNFLFYPILIITFLSLTLFTAKIIPNYIIVPRCKVGEMRKKGICIAQNSFEQKAYNLSQSIRRVVRSKHMQTIKELGGSLEPPIEDLELLSLSIRFTDDITLYEDKIIIKMSDEVELLILGGLIIMNAILLTISILCRKNNTKK